MSRACPSCRAPVPETSIVCEYCGASLEAKAQAGRGTASTDDNRLEAALAQANEFLSKLKRYSQPSYRMIGIEHSTVDKAETATRNLEVFAGENKKVLAIAEELRALIDATNEKLKKSARSDGSKKLILILLYFLGVEIICGVLIWLGHTANPENLKTWIVGGLALICLILGAALGGIAGAVGGAIAGGLLGLLFQWLMSSLTGNILLGVIWNAIFIPVFFVFVKNRL